MTVGIGVLDIIDAKTVEAVDLDTRNMSLDGRVLGVTGVPFEANTIDQGLTV
ncbi:hypothetical protein PGH26_03560 [Sporosarcina jeotgali]|uniref:Uncharacterized protein n=1 Tax=Sporosarcina jeotgali TaxID=3020056 RepID=A0ABZ0KZG3_9BACL|nr:hypothetical protein [Sporosarcina sp. B2O-1]WOV85018.1 hypothetical protein PGH26_03560 [Sporosarcina sp. B2O-1]